MSKISSIKDLTRKSPRAVCIYLMLREYAKEHGGVNELSMSRATIAYYTGINRLATISTALRLLHDHGWIERDQRNEYNEDRSAIINRWINIRFLRNPFPTKPGAPTTLRVLVPTIMQPAPIIEEGEEIR